MEAYQQRVIDEGKELSERIAKLDAFLGTPLFSGLDPAEQFRLRTQIAVMHVYSSILEERMQNFK